MNKRSESAGWMHRIEDKNTSAKRKEEKSDFSPLEFHRMGRLAVAVGLIPVAIHVGQRLGNHVKL